MNEALLPGEKVLASRPANLTFSFDEAKLPELAGHAKARAIGGKVHITTYRIFFAANRLNSTRGSCSVFHPTIAFDEPVTGTFAGQWVVKTATTTLRFAVRDAKELSGLLRQTREKPVDVAALREHVTSNLDKVGAGIAPFWNDVAKAVQSKDANSIQVVALVSARELLTESKSQPQTP